MTRVKICGLMHAADAEAAVEAGADALGFIFERASRRFIGNGELPWLGVLPPFPVKVAVFGRVDRPVPRGLFDIIQGVEWDIFPEPSPKRIHVVRLRPGQKAPDVMETVISASMVLLDTYSESAFGGTGRQVDWHLAAEIVRQSKLPVMLAGGLTPDNVAEAIQIVRPFAVDVSSGVEEKPGVKDAIKIRDFVQAARSAV